MSIDVMRDVWKYVPFKGGPLLVLLAMADWADDDGGSIFPKVETLAKKARLSVRGAQIALRELEEAGVIEIVKEATGRPGRATEYRIVLERVKNVRPLKTGAVRDKDGCNSEQGRVQSEAGRVQNAAPHIDNHHSIHHENHHDEPSAAPAPAATPDGTLPGLPAAQKPERKKRSATEGTRWPPDGRVPFEWHEDAKAACHDDGLNPPDLRREAGKFERYWAAKAGADGRKVDWKKTFINWIVREAENAANRSKQSGKSGASSAHQRGLEGLALLVDEADGRSENIPQSGQLALTDRRSG